MNDRIKAIRKAKALSQKDFAEKLGLTDSAVAKYESGDRTPNGAVISAICLKFGVNQEWLQSGTGEMWASEQADESIADFAGRLLNINAPDVDEDTAAFRAALIRVMARLTPAEWKILKEKADEFSAELRK